MDNLGVELIRLERARQIEEEGHSASLDDELDDGQLAKAAAAYALFGENDIAANLWPFSRDLFKPRTQLQNLVRAGALIAAEIDRLQRVG